jgi:hypothetical protein
MTRVEVVKAIREAAAKLGRTPTMAELLNVCGIARKDIRRCFASLRQAVRAAGLQPALDRSRNSTPAMLEDWAAVARKLGHLPSSRRYGLAGRFAKHSFQRRFGSWSRIPALFRELALESGDQDKWSDVLEMIAENRTLNVHQAALRTRCPLFPERPIFGAPMMPPGLAYAPVNESGVIFLFGAMAPHLGFHVERLQGAFPDCEAMREIEPGRWQRVRIEFEFESRNFQIHSHPTGECDVIVCWRHNWKECPVNIEVIELARRMEEARLVCGTGTPACASAST